jgi:hypothetical protein
MESNTKLGTTPQIMIALISLATVIIGHRGFDPYGHHKKVSDLEMVSRIQGDSIAILSNKNRNLDSTITSLKLELSRIKENYDKCRDSKTSARNKLIEAAEVLR